jgi:hypothetical protein
MRLLRVLALLAVGMLVVGTGVAHADCSGPSGVAGQIIYNTTFNVMQYCNGTNWINMGGVASSVTAAGSTGYIQFNTSNALDAESALIWDKTNNRLGIGSASPVTALDVSGTVTATLFLVRAHRSPPLAQAIFRRARWRPRGLAAAQRTTRCSCGVIKRGGGKRRCSGRFGRRRSQRHLSQSDGRQDQRRHCRHSDGHERQHFDRLGHTVGQQRGNGRCDDHVGWRDGDRLFEGHERDASGQHRRQ